MSKSGLLAIILVLFSYIAFSQYIITGYDRVNTKLMVSIDKLMAECSNNSGPDLDEEY